MADNADDIVLLSENSSDERRQNGKKSMSSEQAHPRRGVESVPLLRMTSPHPAPAAIRSNKARKGKRIIKKKIQETW